MVGDITALKNKIKSEISETTGETGQITIFYKGEQYTIPANLTVSQLLEQLEISPDEFLVIDSNGNILAENDIVPEGAIIVPVRRDG